MRRSRGGDGPAGHGGGRRGGVPHAVAQAAHPALSVVERLRWTRHSDDETAEEFGDARRAFLTAAMIAGLPRRLTEHYARAAIVSAAITRDKVVAGEAPSVEVEVEVEEHLEAYTELVADYLWRPVRGAAPLPPRARAVER